MSTPSNSPFSADYVRQTTPFRNQPIKKPVLEQPRFLRDNIAQEDLGKRARLLKAKI